MRKLPTVSGVLVAGALAVAACSSGPAASTRPTVPPIPSVPPIPTIAPTPTVPAGSRLIRISYAALDFLAPRKQRFRVLLGDDPDEWQDMDRQTVISFLELPPGRHTVQVQAQGIDGPQLEALHARLMSLERLAVKSSDVAFELQLTVAP